MSNVVEAIASALGNSKVGAVLGRMRQSLPAFPWQPAKGIPKLNANVPIASELAALVPQIRDARSFVINVQSYAVQLRQDNANSRSLSSIDGLKDQLTQQQQDLDAWISSAKKAGADQDAQQMRQCTIAIQDICTDILAQREHFQRLRESADLPAENSATSNTQVETTTAPTVVQPTTLESTAPETVSPPDPATEFKNRLKELLSEIQEAKNDKSSEGQEIALLASEAGVLARKKLFPAANETLDRLVRLLEHRAQPREDPATQFLNKFKLLKSRIDVAVKGRSTTATELKLAVSQAATYARQRDFPNALIHLAMAEKLVQRIENEPADSAPSTLPLVKLATFQRLQVRWQEAQTKAKKQLEDMGGTLLLLPDVQQDSRFSQVQRVVKRLPNLIPNFGNALANNLLRASQGGSDQDQCHRDALGILAAYRKQLSAASALRQLAVFATKNLKVQLTAVDEL